VLFLFYLVSTSAVGCLRRPSLLYVKRDVKQLFIHWVLFASVQHYAIRCGYHDRAATIGSVLQVHRGSDGRAMIFCETKRDADELALSSNIRQETHVIHGDIPQDKREMVLRVNTLISLWYTEFLFVWLYVYCKKNSGLCLTSHIDWHPFNGLFFQDNWISQHQKD